MSLASDRQATTNGVSQSQGQSGWFEEDVRRKRGQMRQGP